jgi:Fe-Mn family superoxide dismutase
MASRREFLQKSLLAGIGVSVLGKSVLNAKSFTPDEKIVAGLFQFTLPKLPYGYDALEPWIDQRTMEIHHDKHHQAYVDNLNKARAKTEVAPQATMGVSASPETLEVATIDEPSDNLAGRKELEEILFAASKQDIVVKNNAGGHWNHSFFWEIMRPASEKPETNIPTEKLAEHINQTFGSFEKFKEQFTAQALGRFGSGWAWLVKKEGNLVLTSTPNQDNPLMDTAEVQGTPLLGIDVWEHAYYLKHQNLRAEYIKDWWSVVNWDKVNEHYSK